MFLGTGGISDIAINTTYYTSNTVISGEQTLPDSFIGTWYFNDVLSIDGLVAGELYPLDFKYTQPTVGVKNAKYIRYSAGYVGLVDATIDYYLDTSSGQGAYNVTDSTWNEEQYRTIEILTEPTDETIKKWLVANATKQT